VLGVTVGGYCLDIREVADGSGRIPWGEGPVAELAKEVVAPGVDGTDCLESEAVVAAGLNALDAPEVARRPRGFGAGPRGVVA
jgi:hypothetical protein